MANTVTRLTHLSTDHESGSTGPSLNDDNYRLVLKAKIIHNQWKGTKKELYDFWALYFPLNPILLQDNQDMSMDVTIYGMESQLQQDLVRYGYIFPKPAGVRINFNFPNEAVFAFGYDNQYMKGWGTKWIDVT